jgi:hypothetical protein
MPQALYALAGTVIGILGTVLVDMVRARRDDRSRSQVALRDACSDFAAQVARVRRYSLRLRREPQNHEFSSLLETAFTEARAYYERLFITAESLATQEAARHVIHFTNLMVRAAGMERTGFLEAETQMFNWSARLYAEVRRELGLKHPDNVYKDPSDGLPMPGDWIAKSSS